MPQIYGAPQPRNRAERRHPLRDEQIRLKREAAERRGGAHA